MEKGAPIERALFYCGTENSPVRLSRWPGERPAAKQMQMEVVHRLAAFFAGVHHDAIAIREPLLACDLRRGPHQMAQQCAVIFAGCGHGADVFARNNQNVHWRLGVEVGKSVAQVVLINRCRGDLPFDDLAKNATHGVISVHAVRARRWFYCTSSATTSTSSCRVVPGISSDPKTRGLPSAMADVPSHTA